MDKIIIILIALVIPMLFILIFTFAALTVASRADDQMENYNKITENKKNQKSD